MFVNNTAIQIEAGKIYAFKFVTGEEVIAKVIGATMIDITVHAPLQLTSNTQGVGLAPAFFTISDGADATFFKTGLISYFIPDENFITSYESAVSGIELPSNKIVV